MPDYESSADFTREYSSETSQDVSGHVTASHDGEVTSDSGPVLPGDSPSTPVPPAVEASTTGEPPGTPSEVTVLHRRDRQRFFDAHQKRIILTRQRHVCGGRDCGKPLVKGDTEFHHMVPWALGGPTIPDNGIALCRDCHLVAALMTLPTILPRRWQADALDTVLRRLRLGEFATVAAAPGAGKTKFAILTAAALAREGVIDRVVVLTPTVALTRQWKADFAAFGIPLDNRPVSGRERRGSAGLVTTYQALSNADTVQELAISIDETDTLIVLDEAHHLASDASGQESAWSLAVTRIGGTVTAPRAPVLNLTGTPFRSRADQRITTIRYLPVPGQPDRIEVQADWTVTTGECIDNGDLRHPTMYAFDAGLTAVTAAGSASLTVIDLDDQGPGVRTAALSALLRDENRFIRPVCEQAVRIVAEKSAVLGQPVKAIFVADDTDHANQVYAVLQSLVGRHAHVAHSKTGADAAAVLEQFRSDPAQAFLVTVRMASEGFDVPEAAVLVVANTITAPLFVAQVSARVMRVSDAERAIGMVLPATILIPADSGMVDAYSSLLATGSHTVEIARNCDRCGASPCACRPSPGAKQCSGCGMPWRLCVCLCPVCGGRAVVCGCTRGTAGGPPVLVTVDTDAEIALISHDGQNIDLGLWGAAQWQASGVPLPFIAPAVAAMQSLADANPAAVATALLGIVPPPSGPDVDPGDGALDSNDVEDGQEGAA